MKDKRRIIDMNFKEKQQKHTELKIKENELTFDYEELKKTLKHFGVNVISIKINSEWEGKDWSGIAVAGGTNEETHLPIHILSKFKKIINKEIEIIDNEIKEIDIKIKELENS